MARSSTTNPSDGERAARVALSQLEGVGPARLRWLMHGCSAEHAFEGLCRGTIPVDDGAPPRGVNARLIEGWRAAARGIDPSRLLAKHRDLGVVVLVPGDHLWPFIDDPEPPSVLYVWGDPALVRGRPSAAIVGTRRCTDLGRGIANDLGHELAAAGVAVVSGLALGIDGAAHAGALDAHLARRAGGETAGRPPDGPSHVGVGAPIAVVANGLDRISPRFHRALTERVATHGAVISEAPLGTNGDRWRFPARNRLIAGLSDVVIVVESHAKGGALITVDEAIERGVPVMAVPGSIRSEASSGTNRLLAEGAVPLCSVDDVLTLLEVHRVDEAQGRLFDAPPPAGLVDDADPLHRMILSEVASDSMSIDRLVEVSQHSLAEVMTAVQRLAAGGRVIQVGSTVSLEPEAGRRRR